MHPSVTSPWPQPQLERLRRYQPELLERDGVAGGCPPDAGPLGGRHVAGNGDHAFAPTGHHRTFPAD
jgi:hypothetical protein